MKKTICFDVIEAKVLTDGKGNDLVALTIDSTTTFPNTSYKTTIDIQTAPGFGKEWCQNVLRIEPEIVDIN